MGSGQTGMMMLGNWENRAAGRLQTISYWLAISLALLVPVFDRQPVNALAMLLVFAVAAQLWLAGRQCCKGWDAIDWSMVTLLVSALLSTVFGWPASGQFQGVAEALGYLVIFICVRHGNFSASALRGLGLAAIAGTLIAGATTLATYPGNGAPFELPGVTGTIRSSLYTGIALLLCIGFTLHAHRIWRLVGLAATIFLASLLFAMTSRGVLLTVILCLLLGLFSRYRLRAFKHLMIAAALAAIAVVMMPKSQTVWLQAKTTELIDLVVHRKVSANDQTRIEIWRVALAWIGRGEHVLLGIGPRNYAKIDEDQLDLAPPLQFDATREITHAHNLFLTRYIEQGLFGLLTLLALLGLMARRLLRDGIRGRTDWSWWGAMGGLLLPVVSGLFNSPWGKDYAWFAVLTFALYLGSRTLHAPGSSPSGS